MRPTAGFPSVSLQVPALEVRDLPVGLIHGLPVLLLDRANELVTLPGDDVDIVVGQLPPLFPDLPFEAATRWLLRRPGENGDLDTTVHLAAGLGFVRRQRLELTPA